MKISNSIRNVTFGITTLFSVQAIAGGVVIVHPESGVATLSVKQTRSIFLGKSSKFPGGKKAIAIHQHEGTPSHIEFAEKVLGKNQSQLKSYWTKLVFSGKGLPPKSVADDLAVIDFVEKTPGAVGYVGSSVVDSKVTIVLSFD